MIATPFRVLIVAMVTLLLPVRVYAQEPSSESVNARVTALATRVADLERRLGELEATLKRESGKERPAPPSGNWKELANWRRLSRGISMDQVRVLLGEPDNVKAGSFTYWSWGKPPETAQVTFFDDKVEGWTEPKR